MSSRSRSRSRERSRSRSASPDDRRRGGGERSRSRSPPRRSERPNKDDLFSIMVNALADDVREEDLRHKFEKYGEVGDCFVPRFRDSGRCRGFGFVRFVKEDDMEYALESL